MWHIPVITARQRYEDIRERVFEGTADSPSYLVLLAAHISNIVSQGILIGITWSRTLFLIRGSDGKHLRASLKRHTITWLLLRDGMMQLIETRSPAHKRSSYLGTIYFVYAVPYFTFTSFILMACCVQVPFSSCML